MLGHAVFGPAFRRQSNQPRLRSRPHLDNQTFRVCRGQQVGTMAVSVLRGTQTVREQRPIMTRLEGWWKPATCEEFGCDAHRKGWVTRISLDPMQDSTELQANQARSKYIREQSGRSFTVNLDGSTEVFRFEAGQQCFASATHRVPVERDPIFIHTGATGRSVRMDYDQFFDTFNENSYELNRRQQDG